MASTRSSHAAATNSRLYWTCSHSFPRTRLLRFFVKCPAANPKHRGADGFASFSTEDSSSQSQRASTSPFGPQIMDLDSLTEHLNFFRENRDSLAPEDLCLLMEGLWPSAVREHTPASKLHVDNDTTSASQRTVEKAQKDLFNTASFLQLMNDVIRKMQNFTPMELPRLFGALYNMRWRDRNLFKIVEPMTIRHTPFMSVLDLPKIVQSYVSARCGSPLLYDTVLQRCLQSGKEFSCSDLTILAESFAQSPYKGKQSLVGLEPLVMGRISNFEPEELARLAQAYTERDRDRCDASMELTLEFALMFQNEGGQLLTRLRPEQVVTILKALALWYKFRPHLREEFIKVFHAAVQLLLQSHKELRPTVAARAVWAYCRINAYSDHALGEKLLETLHEDLLPVVDKLPASSLAPCLLSFAKHASRRSSSSQVHASGIPATSELQKPLGMQIVEAAEDQIKKQAEELPVRELASAVLAFSLLRIGSADLYAVLQQGCMTKCHDFPMEQAASILWSFATVRLGNSFFREVQIDILERLHQLSVHAVCDVIWAYCVVRHYDAHFFKTLLATLVPSRLADDPRCALLCPAILDIRRHFPDMDPEGLDRYSNYVSNIFHNQQLQNAPRSSELESLVKTLRCLSMDPKMHVNVDGYVVDVLVGNDLEGVRPVAVLYHAALPAPAGTLHFVTGEPLGETMLRQRYLRGLGYSVVNVWDRSWKEFDSEQRLAFLQTKISKARQAKQPTVSQYRASS